MKQLIGYITGTLSGMMLLHGWNVFTGRDGLPGGEILIVPLFVLLVVFGWHLGTEHGYQTKGFRRDLKDKHVNKYRKSSRTYSSRVS